MNTIKILFFILILFPACQRGEEIRYIPLSAFDKSFINYSEFEAVPFIHSNGFEFNLIVESKTISTRQSETKHPRDDYTTYEVLRCKLNSVEPELNIEISVMPKAYEPFLRITVGDKGFFFNTQSPPDMDSIILNNTAYFDIFLLGSGVYDTTVIFPSGILYTKEEGILLIKMSNNETFTIQK